MTGRRRFYTYKIYTISYTLKNCQIALTVFYVLFYCKSYYKSVDVVTRNRVLSVRRDLDLCFSVKVCRVKVHLVLSTVSTLDLEMLTVVGVLVDLRK